MKNVKFGSVLAFAVPFLMGSCFDTGGGSTTPLGR